MSIFIRIYNRFFRELYWVLNMPYLLRFKKISALKNVIVYFVKNNQKFSDKHIPLTSTICRSKSKKLIIHLPYGGLGDHLLYSHIPRLAKTSGEYSEVLISNKSLIRNKTHLDYIWKRNPYVDGFTDEENLHNYNDPKIATFDINDGNILDQIMLSYGIDDGIRWHDPELFFKVPIFPELQGKNVYDPNFISYSGSLSSQKINNFFVTHNYKIDFQFKVRSSLALPVINFDNFIMDSSFEDFCGILVSCDKLFTLTTGTATLAAALRRPTTVFSGKEMPKYFQHSKCHTYVSSPK